MANRFVPGSLFSERRPDSVEKKKQKTVVNHPSATSYQVFEAELKPNHKKGSH